MNIGAIIIIIIVSIVLVITFYIIGVYNSLLDAKNRVEDQFRPIDLELNKILEIIPNIIDILKKDAKYEEKIINEIEKLKNKLIKTNTINEKIKLASSLNKTLLKIFELKQTYPELKNNKNFTSLQKNLKDTKEKIKYSSTFYNDAVYRYNNVKKEFPANIISKTFKFKEINLLELE